MHLILSAAQAPAASDPLSGLLKYGVLGLFCFLLIIALIWVVKAWKATMEQRIVDAQTYANGLKDVNDAGNKVSTEVKTTVGGLERSHGELRASNQKEHGDLTKAVGDLREKQGEFIAAAKAAKGEG